MKNNRFKTSICILLLFSMLIFPAENLEAKIYNGTTGDNCTYTVDTEKKSILIEGEGIFRGRICDYSKEYDNMQNIHLIIGEGITEVHFISSSDYVESVQLPESLQIIGEHAFESCTRLKSITIPSGVNTVAKDAFEGCSMLKTITNYSSQTVYLPNHPSLLHSFNCYDYYYVEGKPAVTVPPGKTAIAETKYMVALDCNEGKLNKYFKYYKNHDIYFHTGEPLILPVAEKKGYVFCGWATKVTTNIAWYNITNEDNENYLGSTLYWFEPIKLYAQYAKVQMKKLGKGKLKVSLSKYQDAGQLEIQYSTNKNFKNAKSIDAFEELILQRTTLKKKPYTLKYNKKKKTLSLTLSKLKAKKKYYFRFQYKKAASGWTKEDITAVGDWFQKSVKM